MEKNQDEKRSLWQRLKVRYHLSIVNKNLFLEVYSRNISLGRLILLVTASTFSVSLLTYLIIAFTPVKSYIIPGYESASDHAYLIENTKQLFRLQKKVQSKIEYSLKLDSTFQDFGIPVDSINKMTFEKVNLEARNNDLLPEWEEIAATSMAVQNLWISCVDSNIGGYWSTPKYIHKLNDFLSLNKDEKCLGLFYLGVHNSNITKNIKRKSISEKIQWFR